MEIKTIKNRLDNAESFDADVNAALADGWRLTRRDFILPIQPHTGTTYFHTMLYAELVKLDPPAEPEKPDPLTAMRIIKAECDSVDSCEDCTLQPWCNYHRPNNWTLPEEVQNHDTAGA